MTIIKPMLASPAPQDIKFPVFASPKLDGVRALVVNGVLMSRNMKPIPNGYTQDLFGKEDLTGLDGELCVGPPYAQDVMQRTTSGVMSRDGEPDVTFYVFDYYNHVKVPYHERAMNLFKSIGVNSAFNALHPRVRFLEQILSHDADDLAQMESLWLAQGYEGAMVRSINGLYKYGRSTVREGYMLKVKRFVDAEAVVIGFEEYMQNLNEPMRDNLGYQTRSSHKENLVGMNMLGALCVRCPTTGVEFNIGTGYDHATRIELWARRSALLGKLVKYKTFAASGVKDKPRFPVFLGFRDPNDLS